MMIKRLAFLLILMAVLVAGCDSNDAIATVTARAEGTSTALMTLTALARFTPTRTPTPVTPTPEAAETATPTPVAAAPTPVAALESSVAWFGDSTLYLLFVRSFRDSDGDGIGDLRGVIEGLDYLQSLGITTLWLMPVFASPSYHGYDITDYYQVNPDYGTNADLIALIEAVHARGMTILLDYVFHHTSDQHPFFRDAFGNPQSEYAEFYIWRDEAHTSYATFSTVRSMPRLNFDSPRMRQYAVDVALHWMDPNGDGDFSDGVDGFRIDVATGIPVDFWAELRAAMDRLNPRAVLLGELWTDGRTIARYLQGDGLNAAFDFPTFMILTGSHDRNGDGVLSGKGDPSFVGLNMRAAANLNAPGTYMVRFVGNHDTNRVLSDVEGDMARARMAAVWLLTAPGVPMLYYGEEIGMKGSKGTGNPYWDEYRREPLDWYAAGSGPGMATWFRPANRNNAPNDGISVEEQENDPESLLNFYRRLGRLRLDTPALRGGGFALPRLAGAERALYVLQRWDDNTLFLVVINFSAGQQTLKDLAAYAEVEGKRVEVDALAIELAQGLVERGEDLTLEPAGFVIFRAAREAD